MSKQIRFNVADFETVKSIALEFPGTEESTSHEGTPSVKMKGKLMCRLHESGQFIPIRMDYELRENYLVHHPGKLFLPDNFKSYPYLALKTGKHDEAFLRRLLSDSWYGLASRREMAIWEAMQANKM